MDMEYIDTNRTRFATAIHHIATVWGFLTGIYYLFFRKQNCAAKILLLAHMLSQGFGCLKILCDLSDGKGRFEESFQHVEELCEENKNTQGLSWLLLISAVLFKVGIPAMLGRIRKR